MSKYTVAITRVSYYEVDAGTEDEAIDAALEGTEPETHGETTSALVTAVDGMVR